jgi:hypothetical protein
MSDLWPQYAVLEYSRPGVNPVRFAVILRRHGGPAIVIRPDWGDGLRTEDSEYLTGLFRHWLAFPSVCAEFLLQELLEPRGDALILREQGEATPQAVASLVYECC